MVINLAGGYIDGVTERLHLERVRISVDVLRLQQDRDSPACTAETGERTDYTLHAELLPGGYPLGPLAEADSPATPNDF